MKSPTRPEPPSPSSAPPNPVVEAMGQMLSESWQREINLRAALLVAQRENETLRVKDPPAP